MKLLNNANIQSSFSLQHELTLSTAKICHPVLILVQNNPQPKPAQLSGDQSGERGLCISGSIDLYHGVSINIITVSIDAFDHYYIVHRCL